jgi:hypothetical protein
MLRQSAKKEWGKESAACIAFQLGAVENAVHGIEESIEREWVAFKLRTTPGKENTRKRQLFYFILLAH